MLFAVLEHDIQKIHALHTIFAVVSRSNSVTLLSLQLVPTNLYVFPSKYYSTSNGTNDGFCEQAPDKKATEVATSDAKR